MLSKKFNHVTVLILVVLGLWLAGCNPSQPVGTPTVEPALVLTAAAETAVFRLTQELALTPTQEPASATPQATSTATLNVISSPTPTLGAVFTLTPTTSQSGLPERMQYVADLTIPDGTDFSPNSTFTKTWRIKNAGSSTWTTAYALAFFSGEKMGAPDQVNLAAAVPPAGTIDVSVNMASPSQAGSYRGYWKLKGPSGNWIEEAVYVEIDVVSTSGATATTGPTPTNSGPTKLTDISVEAKPAEYTGACPYSFTFTGKFTLNQPDTVTYVLEAGSETPGFTFSLPGPQSVTYSKGEQVLNFNLEFTQSVQGWVRLHITEPIDVTSNQAEFNLICEP